MQQNELSRREFIKRSILAGGALFLSGKLPISATEFSVGKAKEPED